MKHIFSVGSHLTFYIAHKIINTDALKADDCIFLLSRNYHIPNKYNLSYKNQIHTSYNVFRDKSSRIFAGFNVFKTKQNIAAFDHLLSPFLNNDEFIFYTAVCSNDVSSLMVTKKKCVGYYVIEDGLGSYSQTNFQSFKGWKYILYKCILKPFFYRIYAIKENFITTDSKKFKGCIATNSMCFPLHQQYLRVIGLPFEKETLHIIPDAILSVDPLYLLIDKQTIKQVYQDLSLYMKSYSIIAYKFHPAFYAKTNTNLRKQYAQMIFDCFGGNLIELAQDVVLENVLMNYQCDFYTDNSSVAIYGYLSGAKCYSYASIIKQHADVEIFTPPIFDKICIPIDTV